MTETKELVTTISAQDKRALAHADAIAFQLHEGQARIRAILRAEHSPTGFDQEHAIYTTNRVYNYQGDPGDDYSCFHLEMHAKMDLVVQTLIRRIRTGDTLQLRWVRGNDNPLNKRIDWHRDELYLGIHHEKGPDEEYLVEVRVGPDDTARMVRRP